MQKIIELRGVANEPNDYQHAEGELSVSFNAVKHNGSVRVVEGGVSTGVTIDSTETLKYIHTLVNDGSKRYIVLSLENSNYYLKWFGSSGTRSYLCESALSGVTSTEDVSVTSVKNVLVISTPDGIKYAKVDGSSYKWLGAAPKLPIVYPFVKTKTNKKQGLATSISLVHVNDYSGEASVLADNYGEEFRKHLYESFFPLINSMRNDIHEDGKFVFPFLVRFALTLYDGSHVDVSAPMLMTPILPAYPCCYSTKLVRISGEKDVYSYKPVVVLPSSELKYYIGSISNDWEDIVSGVDVYVSNEIVSFTDSEKSIQNYDGWDSSSSVDAALSSIYPTSFKTCSNASQSSSIVDISANGSLSRLSVGNDETKDVTTKDGQLGLFIRFNRVDGSTFGEELSSVSSFYKIDTIALKDLSSEGVHIPKMSISTINNIGVTESLDVSGITNNEFVSGDVLTYNNRMCVVCDRQRLKRAYNVEQLVTATSFNNETIVHLNAQSAFVRIMVNGSSKFVKLPSVSSTTTITYGCQLYAYYPHSGAKEIIILGSVLGDSSQKRVYTIQLKQCDGLSGAYAYNGGEEIGELKEVATLPSYTEDRTYNVGNVVYQSEVNNPFVFLNGLTSQIGCERVDKLAVATLPISTSQFGQHPIYAFTNEGIFALQINSEGKMVSVQPVSRDVCNNPKSVTTLTQSILFTSERGLMELSGGQTKCICEELKGHNFVDLLNATINGNSLNKVKTLSGASTLSVPAHIEDWLASANILYDYKHGLVYVYQPVTDDYNTGYVFSTLDNTWGMYENRLKYNVNTYTDALAVGQDGSSCCLIDMAGNDSARESRAYNTLIITRPIDFEVADIHKTIEDVLARGNYDQSKVKLVIWSSNDLRNWLVIGSSTNARWRNYSGTPYKYFRIGVIAKMTEKDSINALSVNYTPRLNNKLR